MKNCHSLAMAAVVLGYIFGFGVALVVGLWASHKADGVKNEKEKANEISIVSPMSN